MARQRNYKAEYARRNAKSKAERGITYGQERRLVEKGKQYGFTSHEVRRTLENKKGTKDLDSLLATALNFGYVDIEDLDIDVSEFWSMYSKR